MPFRLSIVVLGLLLALPLRAQDTGLRTTPAGVVVDFQQADIRLVLAALAEAGGLNVTFGDLPARSVTVRLTQPVPPQNLLPLMRSLASSNGLRLVEVDGVVHVENAAGPPGLAGGAAGAGGQEGSQGTRLFVYRLKHARAQQLAATLQQLYGGGGTGPRPTGYNPGPRTLSQQLQDQQLPPVDPAQPNADPFTVRPPQQQAGLPGDVAGEVQIVADEPTNALLVRATPGDWEVVRQAIDLLDLRPLQVMIEVLIAEVSRNSELSVGLSGRASNENARRPISGIFGQADSVVSGGVVLRVLRLGGLDLDVTLNALASSGDVRILSRPLLMAQNNKEARMLVGDQVPFLQVVRTLPTSDAVRDQVVQYRDVGTSLSITPTINPDGYVSLQVTQEVSAITGESAPPLNAPQIGTREASTHLFVRDGQTVVIGGLIATERTRTRGGVPFLRDVPLLGWIFGSTGRRARNTELFLFLTPHIVYSDEDIDALRARAEANSSAVPEGGPTAVMGDPRGGSEIIVPAPNAAPT
ncbi:MAG TPA: secretin N-terminal domain-containing protein, partial [Longimicrobium sp.]